MKQRIISFIMALVMIFTLLPSTVWAAADTAEDELEHSLLQAAPETQAAAGEDGAFLLLAANSVEVIIQPERIPYTAGQTIAQALASSTHRFTGMKEDGTGYISAIDGKEGLFRIMDEAGGYELNRPASAVQAVMIVACRDAEGQAQAIYSLACAMLTWQEASTQVQRYAQTEYQAAKKALVSGGDFAALATVLTDKIEDYQRYDGAEKHTLKLAVQNLTGQPLTSYTFLAEDAYGNRHETTGVLPQLSAGTYTFSLTAGNNGAEGEMTVDGAGGVAVDGQTISALRIPQGAEWIALPALLSKNNGDPERDAYPVNSSGSYASTVLLPDTVGARGGLFLYAYPGAGLQLSADQSCYEWDGSEVQLYAVYDAVDGTHYDIKRAWLSAKDTLNDAVRTGSEGGTVCLTARAETDGYTAYQTWTLTLERTPTLSDLQITAGNVRQNIGFSPEKTEYSCTVTAEAVVLTPVHSGGAYTVTVNDQPLTEGCYTLALEAGTVTTARVAVTNGKYTQTYIVAFTRANAVPVTVSHEKDVAVKIYNAAEEEIGADESGRYPLTPGESYTCVATKAVFYHTEMVFTVPAESKGMTVQAATPDTVDHLTGLRLSSHIQADKGTAYLKAEEFKAELHSYSAPISDVFPSLFAWVTVDDGGYTAEAFFQSEGRISILSGQTLGTTIGKGLKAGPERQTLTIRVSKEGTVDGGKVTYYQDYQVIFNKKLSLENVTLTVDGQETPLFIVENGSVTTEEEFIWNINHYQAAVLRSAQEAQLTVTLPFAGYGVRVNGGETVYSPDAEQENGKVVISLPLDTGRGKEEFVLTAAYGDGIPYSYTITLQKGDPVATTVTIQDETTRETLSAALAALYDDRNGTRVWPDGETGQFLLVEGLSYTCVATCPGYVGQKLAFSAKGSELTKTIRLKPAEKVSHGANVTSGWPSFRKDNSNNGVVDACTPISRETAVLSWANQLGEGYSSKALSCPILITQDGVDYLIVYSATDIYKVESVTGTVVAQGKMSTASDFAINSATFGDGMLFVGLEKGTVQAFDADTLESLWLYHDPLKGQANCPLTYADGCVYTGFWNNETEDASFVCLTATDEDPASNGEEKLARWTYTSKGGFYWAGTYVDPDNRYLLVGTDDGDASCTSATSALLCMDPATGEVLDMLSGLKGDIRCSIAEKDGRVYFTSKGGCFYSVKMNSAGIGFDHDSLKTVALQNGGGETAPAMSTSTPVVHNGRAYIGVSGTSQFGAYSGHSITVIDLSSWAIAYRVPTKGYPQTSGLLTTAYGEKTYVYFFDNYTPGKLRVLEDTAGQTEPTLITEETYQEQGVTNTVKAAYALFTPEGSQSEYAICSPITDAYGTLYFKNDSAYLMALSNAVKVAVKTMPTKTAYAWGEKFDPTGMELTVTYANGMTRDLPVSREINGETITYFECDETVEDEDFRLTYAPLLYRSGDQGEQIELSEGVTIRLTVTSVRGDVNKDGKTDVYDLQRLYEHCSGIALLEEETLQQAGLGGTAPDMQNLYSFLNEGVWEDGNHAIKIKAAAIRADEVVQGQQYRLYMRDIFDACRDAKYTLAGGDFGPQTKLAKDSGGWYLSFTNSTVGEYRLAITASCGSVSRTHTVTMTVTQADPGDPGQYGYIEEDASSVTVYVTISNDGVPLRGKDGTVLSHLKVELPYFDLRNQNMQEFYRYHTTGGQGHYVDSKLVRRPTLLHLYLYLLGVYCQGYTADEVVTGQKIVRGSKSLYQYEDMLGMEPLTEWNNLALNITGSATSMYMEQFWGHDQNLMYYRNHMFPLMSAGWGSTADYILLKDGDTIDLAMFTDWSFYRRGAFACFNQDAYTVKVGDALTFRTQKYDTQSVSDGGSESFTTITGLDVRVYDEHWSIVAPVDSPDGSYTYTFDAPGNYYLLALDPDKGTTDACIAPATARVTVS